MNSSYKNKLTYGDLFEGLIFSHNPNNIVEFGILDGYSLTKFIETTDYNTQIRAYDIFDDFNGNHSNYDNMAKKFEKYKNVMIERGDFYAKYKDEDFYGPIDILHVDIANNGDVYDFVFTNYIKHMSKNGLIILEGGSKERDEIEWMNKYNKPKIVPVIEKFQLYTNYKITTIGTIPSVTLVKLL